MPPIVLIRPTPVTSPVVLTSVPTQTPARFADVHTDTDSEDGGVHSSDESDGTAIVQPRLPPTRPSSAMLPSAPVEGPPKTREELKVLLDQLQFHDKIVKLEVHLAMSIQITKTVIKISRSVAPHDGPGPVLVLHCKRLPNHHLLMSTPQLVRRWSPLEVQDHKQDYLYIVSETRKITINVTFKLIDVERR